MKYRMSALPPKTDVCDRHRLSDYLFKVPTHQMTSILSAGRASPPNLLTGVAGVAVFNDPTVRQSPAQSDPLGRLCPKACCAAANDAICQSGHCRYDLRKTERPPYGGLPEIRSVPNEEWSSPYFLPGLRQRRLIWFQVSPRSRKNFGDAFDTGRQRALQELNALRELLRIAVGRLPCFVENADKYGHAGCLPA